jgi:hypothetical protein
MSNATTRALAIIASGYARRKLERVYDALISDTVIGAELRALSPLQKRGVELALYAAGAMIDAKVPERSALGVLFKQVLMDAGPEIARRMLTETGYKPAEIETLLSHQPAHLNVGAGS